MYSTSDFALVPERSNGLAPMLTTHGELLSDIKASVDLAVGVPRFDEQTPQRNTVN